MGVGMRSISVRTSMVVGGLAALMLALCGGWLDRVGNSLADQGEQERALATAGSMEASLRSIMLTGHADIVRDWIGRISSLPDIDHVRIYRTDGNEAFVDQSTLRKVNQWLGEERFPLRDEPQAPARVADKLGDAFKAVATSSSPYVRRDDSEHMTLIYPIHAEAACMQCHGYDQQENRGVLVVSLSTVQAAALIESLKGQALMIFFAMGMLLVLGVWIYTRQTILNPIVDFAETARRIVAGNRLQRFDCSSQDELGELAACSNSLLDQLEAELVVEQRLRAREQGLLEATVSLSCQGVSDEVLRRVGELAREMTGARYVMLSHLDINDQKQFIAFGMAPEVEQKIARLPEGKGLLGLLWREGKPVRIDHIQAHPASVGFPEGHPFMRNFLGLPIRFGEQVIGALYLTDRVDGEPFSVEDQTVLEALSAACGVALANAQSMEKIRRLNDGLELQVCERTEELQTSNARLRAREMELEIINEELMQASEAKNQFLANTSHELRTPLNAIIGFSELMGNPRLGALNEKQKRYVDNIHSSGKRLLKIITAVRLSM